MTSFVKKWHTTVCEETFNVNSKIDQKTQTINFEISLSESRFDKK